MPCVDSSPGNVIHDCAGLGARVEEPEKGDWSRGRELIDAVHVDHGACHGDACF